MGYFTLTIGLVDVRETLDSESASLMPNSCLQGSLQFVHTVPALMSSAIEDAFHLNWLKSLSHFVIFLGAVRMSTGISDELAR